MSMKKKIGRWFLLLVFLVGVGFLSAGIVKEGRKIGKVRHFQKEIEQLEKENEKLKAKLDYVSSEEFLRKESYEKLGLVREGETVLVVSKEKASSRYPSFLGASSLPVWKQWWRLFF